MSQSNYIYYDLIQTHLENADTRPPQCDLNERRNQEFITNPEDYKFTITRFMIDTPSLPLFRPTIQYIEPSDDPDVLSQTISPDITIYSVSLKLNTDTASDTTVARKYIVWETQDETKPAPQPPYYNSNGIQDNSTGYYNCYAYSWFLRLINDKFLEAATGLGLSSAPTLTFVSASNLFVFSAPSALYDSSLDTYYEIYMNKALY